MKLVIREMLVLGVGACRTGYQIVDEHSGLRFPSAAEPLLTKEQAHSPIVHDAATTYFGIMLRQYTPASGDLFKTVPEHKMKEAEAKLLAANEAICKMCGTVVELRRQLLGLQERNDRQAAIITAVQGAVLAGGAK